MSLEEERISAIIKSQQDFFSQRKTLDLCFRRLALLKLRKSILQHRTELENALSADLGKCRHESYMTEIGFVLSEISHTLKHFRVWASPSRKKSSFAVFPSRCYVQKQPYGIVLILGPYNYPFQLLIGPLVAAISAGNCAILCPSDQTPTVSSVIQSIIQDVFPANYVYCTAGGVETNNMLLRHRFDKIFFTGSARVGKLILQAAANHLTPVILELGGKSPVIVDETASLSACCERIVWGKFMNAGQTCVAPDYVFVHKDIFLRFLDGLKEAIQNFYGKNIKENSDYGRIVNERNFKRLQLLLEKDRSSVVWGGETREKDLFIAPTILCPPRIEQAACMQEEIFGPLLPVFEYRSIEEPISFINSQEKPLALYVFSESSKNIDCILNSTISGGVGVNDTVSQIINSNLPFGGVGASGMGNYHGEYGFYAFTHLRSVLRRSTSIRMKLAYPPFSDKKMKTIQKFLK